MHNINLTYQLTYPTSLQHQQFNSIPLPSKLLTPNTRSPIVPPYTYPNPQRRQHIRTIL